MKASDLRSGTIVELFRKDLINGNGPYLVSNENYEMLKGNADHLELLQDERETDKLMQILLNDFAKLRPLRGNLFTTTVTYD